MKALPTYPSLCQINTRVWLMELSRELGRPATLDDIPDAELDRLAEMGIDLVWLLSVWRTGPAGQRISRSNPEWRREFQETLPDLCDDDIPGSGFAITGYKVHRSLGGDAALARLRKRLSKRGLRLLLDFVPNHTGLDHQWVDDHPEYYIPGTEPDLARAPQNFTWAKRKQGDLLLAHGRDPYFPGWPDTLQLNYGNPATQEAMIGELRRIAGQCDGIRCDMAMLVLPEVFQRTWGIPCEPFWPRATQCVREQVPGFCFMAEVYWDLEWPRFPPQIDTLCAEPSLHRDPQRSETPIFRRNLQDSGFSQARPGHTEFPSPTTSSSGSMGYEMAFWHISTAASVLLVRHVSIDSAAPRIEIMRTSKTEGKEM